MGIVLNKNQNKNYPAGDFRSRECIELLKEADVVVTNPPFSLWRKFLAQLMEYNKKFLIIGELTHISKKEVFPLVKKNKIWLGAPIRSGSVKFEVASYYDLWTVTSGSEDGKGNKFLKMVCIRWFTNLKVNYKVKLLDLSKNYYTPEKYPKYDNYDAINVDKVTEIPCDYPGIMGVPLSFMDKYCPEQFEIVGLAKRGGDPRLKTKNYTKDEYDNYSDLNSGPTILKDSLPKVIYSRILIKNKHPENKKHS